MRIASVNNFQFNGINKININHMSFGKHYLGDGISDTFERHPQLTTEENKTQTMQYLANKLKEIGVKAKIRDDNYLEIKKFNPKWYSRLNSGEDELPADLVFQYTKKINGSVNFGELGVTDLGALTTLAGTFGQGGRFDFAGAKIKDFGNLRRIDGDMIVDKNQFDNFDFTNLKVSGNMFVANTAAGKTSYKKLSEMNKNLVLNGFKLLTY